MTAPHRKKITWRREVHAFTVSEPWSNVLNASMSRGMMSSAAWEVVAKMTKATSRGTTITRRPLILMDASAGAMRALISALLDAPFKLPHVGHGVSSILVANVEGWMRKHEAELLDPLRARMCCSGWKMLGPRMETWWRRIRLLK